MLNKCLHPCPFCGSIKADFITENAVNIMHEAPKTFNNGWFIICSVSKGGCGLLTGYHKTKEAVAITWNTRKYQG